MNDRTDCPVGVENRERIRQLELRMDKVEKAVLQIRDHLINRPSWAVLTIVTFLSSACVGLLLLVLR